MTRLIMKFGGVALANVYNAQAVIDHVLRAYQQGHEVIVVISAPIGTTDSLIQQLNHFTCCPHSSPREYDLVVSAGEQVAAGILASLLCQRGIEALSFTGWQLPIHTDQNHKNADILDIATQEIEAALALRKIPIITGFQGIAPDKSITTLGRGGSDLTAVALAYYLKAHTCRLYKDVDGIHTARHHLIHASERYDFIDYTSLLQLAQLGIRIMTPKSVEWAQRYQIPLHILSFLKAEPVGTHIHAGCAVTKPQVILLPEGLDQHNETELSLRILNAPTAFDWDKFPIREVNHFNNVVQLKIAKESLMGVAEALHQILIKKEVSAWEAMV